MSQGRGVQVVDVVTPPQGADSNESSSLPAEVTRLDTAVTAWLTPGVEVPNRRLQLIDVVLDRLYLRLEGRSRPRLPARRGRPSRR